MIFNFKSTADAKTLEGKTADEFANADHGHTADEVGALSKSGGTLWGDLNVKKSKDSLGYSSVMKNASATADYGTQIRDFNSDGEYSAILLSANNPLKYREKDGKENIVLHTGNMASHVLPLTGGTLTGVTYFNRGGDCVGYGRIHQDHNSTINYGLSLRDYTADGEYVEIRVNSAMNRALFRNHDGYSKEIHHDGNSAKVVISETAPADTSALWVY